MWIYNLLFYKSFSLAQKSKNFDETPVVGGMLSVLLCITLNIAGIVLFIRGLGLNIGMIFTNTNSYFYGAALIGLLLFYYLYKERYKKIVERYKQKTGPIMQLHPIIVIIAYIGLSVLLMFIAGAFKNHEWFFAP